MQIQTQKHSFKKMCNYVEKDEIYAYQPNGEVYDYYFDQYSYDTVYDVVKSGWYDGRRIFTNEFTVEFATDDTASFYGFKLKWAPWAINKCESGQHTCDINAICKETNNGLGYKCKCKTGFEGDGEICSVGQRINSPKPGWKGWKNKNKGNKNKAISNAINFDEVDETTTTEEPTTEPQTTTQPTTVEPTTTSATTITMDTTTSGPTTTTVH